MPAETQQPFALPPNSVVRPVKLDNVPVKILLDIFHKLGESSTSWRDVSGLAMTCRPIYHCFEDNRPAIFRHMVEQHIPNGPGLFDLVLKIGTLRLAADRPTDPTSLRRLLRAILRDCSTTRDRQPGFTPEVSAVPSPAMYGKILHWVRSETTVEGRQELRRRTEIIRRARCDIDGDVVKIYSTDFCDPRLFLVSRYSSMLAARYPLDVLYFDRFAAPELHQSLLVTDLSREVKRYEEHANIPLAEWEERLLGTSRWLPCCLMFGACPRILRRGSTSRTVECGFWPASWVK